MRADRDIDGLRRLLIERLTFEEDGNERNHDRISPVVSGLLYIHMCYAYLLMTDRILSLSLSTRCTAFATPFFKNEDVRFTSPALAADECSSFPFR